MRQPVEPSGTIAEPPRGSVSGRRALVIAGVGADGGAWALRAACRWLHRSGRTVAALDLDASPPLGAPSARPGPYGAAPELVPIARVPAGPVGIRAADPPTRAAVLERLLRHESAAEVLIARIPARHRMTLMRAAFLAGGLVVPLDGSERALSDAFAVSRQARESFLELSLRPCCRDAPALRRYLEIMRQFVGAEPRPLDFEEEDPEIVLGRLSALPGEGFAAALLAPDTPAPPTGLLELGTIVV